MGNRAAVLGFAAGLALAAPTGYALQEFTLDEARTRIERLEARVAALESSGEGRASPDKAGHDVGGQLYLSGPDNVWGKFQPGAECRGDGGFRNIAEGAAVRALDGAGNAIGTAWLGPGTIQELPGFQTCLFEFVISLPDADFYEFEVAGRSGPTFSRDDMDANGWAVTLAIGD